MGDATGTRTFPGFAACAEFIRSGNGAVHEDGFWWLLERAPAHVDELLAAAAAEADDFARVSFIELLGATRSREAVPLLRRMLSHPHRDTRVFSVYALEELGLPETLEAAQAHRRAHPGDFE